MAVRGVDHDRIALSDVETEHPELTGRENIFLNGAILGMSRVEITRKFDEIVAFAEVERFLDTQVKHYSSGMYVRLAFAVAASANLPVIIFSVFWKRFNTTGAVAGLSVGLASSIILILLSPNGVFGKDGAIFPLENPGIVSIPIGFIAAWLGTILTARDPEAEAKFAELTVRAHTGLGAEKATSH